MPPETVLDQRLSFRLPAAVADAWRAAAQAAGLSLSDWVRSQVSVGGEVPVTTRKPSPRKIPKLRTVVPVDPLLVRAVANAGNNLNQIARSLNSRDVDVSASAILVMLVETERRLQEILDTCTSSS
ncbi:MobC family plasmid mobilization relaxosome protein [Acidithiobacillus thiooxidans]|uniref:plasmid mobilization relaxosome protein MobC n=1 Tax=Acidithiobacillus thiooxidans TaxID=930 RepID=UPI001C078958|nr:plasmid mobilization relaxosome protein MobC [Acidithiobacillus thiooxidans]MBU2750121.1 MobC family plasmid mobilization relaxosome protein [Acidithiobacillus thiooxidans]